MTAIRGKMQDMGISAPLEDLRAILSLEAHRGPVNALTTYLTGLVWDGESRLEMWLIVGLGCMGTPLHQAYGAMWAISAVARALSPGCKVDTVLLLRGPQGVGKSKALRALVGAQWFRDTAIPWRDKDKYQQLLGAWIYELSELAGVLRTNAGEMKAFISSQQDTFRPSFGRGVVPHPRRLVFCATTNELGALNDPTGSRRWWPVETGIIDLPWIEANRDQLWAEAVHYYGRYCALRDQGIADDENPFRWWLPPEGEAAREEAADEYRDDDPLAEALGVILRPGTPTTVGFIIVSLASDAYRGATGEKGTALARSITSLLPGLGWVRDARKSKFKNKVAFVWRKKPEPTTEGGVQ